MEETTIKFLSKKELDAVFDAISKSDSKYKKRNLLIFKMGYFCGVRVSELVSMKVKDYRPDSREIYCARQKGGISNTIRLDKNIDKLLKQYIKENSLNDDDYIFESQYKKAISRQMVDKLTREYFRAAKIKDTSKYHFHVLRHTRAVIMLEDGYSLEQIKFLLGHKRYEATCIYAQFSSNAQKDLFDRMDKES